MEPRSSLLWTPRPGSTGRTSSGVTSWVSGLPSLRPHLQLGLSDSERSEVGRTLKELEEDDLLHSHDMTIPSPGQRRRAAVFYVDQGNNVLSYISWWIFTWRFIGLHTAEEGFDLVFMTHPATVANLSHHCHLVTDSFSLNFTSPGRCLYKPYLGIAYRDKSYDPYMNSQECLYGPGSEFLSQYSTLLRADLDTFPGPR